MATPEQWRDTLLKQLEDRAKSVCLAERYYDGDHPLPGPPERMSRYQVAVNAYKNLSKMGVTNYLPLIADAPAERLRVTGFRFGEVENANADPDAWRIWQRNQMDADFGIVIHTAIKTGQAACLVWPENGQAVITAEHPANVIVAYEPGSRRKRRAGLKCWNEDDGTRRVVLYLPGEVFKWRSKNPIPDDGLAFPVEYVEWQPSTDSTWPIANPLGAVNLVEFRANPDLKPAPFGGGTSEFAKVLSIQDRINKTIFDRMVTAEFQAFRQRWAIGWTPDDPNEAMKASMSNIMTFEAETVKVGEFAQADFAPFIKSVESDVQSMAAITQTPAFYTLGGSISNISGDTLKALQDGLIAKSEAHRDNFSESAEEVLRLALQAEGDARANDTSSMVIWRDLEHRTWAETTDAVVKMQALGVPKEALWAMLPNVTPQDIERWRVMAADEALFAPEPPVAPAFPNAAA